MIYISATQIDTYLRCPRAWAWPYVAGKPKIQSPATELGSETHRLIEVWERTAEPPVPSRLWRNSQGKDLYPGKVALGMIDTLLKQGINPKILIECGGLVEYEFNLVNDLNKNPIIEGVTLTGKIDLTFQSYEKHEGSNVPVKTLYIVDHKTSSDPKEWGKSEESLVKDTQKILYSFAAWYLLGHAAYIIFALNYGSTKSEYSKNYFVQVKTSYEQVLKDFHDKLKPAIIEMRNIKTAKPNPLDLSCNPEACGMFRGCPYISDCQLTGAQKMKGLMMSNSLVDRILAAKAGKTATPVQPTYQPPEAIETPVPIQEPAPTPTPIQTSSIMDQIRTRKRRTKTEIEADSARAAELSAPTPTPAPAPTPAPTPTPTPPPTPAPEAAAQEPLSDDSRMMRIVAGVMFLEGAALSNASETAAERIAAIRNGILSNLRD